MNFLIIIKYKGKVLTLYLNFLFNYLFIKFKASLFLLFSFYQLKF